jgi:peptide/nickel transport system substrate-binding protein
MDGDQHGRTRREVIKTLGAAVAAVGVASPSRRAAAQTPKPGGTVRVSHPGTPRNLDPAKQVSGDEYMITNQVFETLVHFNYDGKLQPLLAESWEKSPDLRTWTFNLRKGVQFHHGREMNAEDVKTTIEHVLDPKTGCTLRTALEMIETIETPNPYQVRFRLKFGYAELDAPLSSREASIVAKEKMDNLSKDVSGTGPFKFKEIVQGDRAVVVKNPDYWRKGLPYLDEVVFKEIPEAATRQTSIQKGDTDIFWQVPFDLVDQIGKARGIKLSEVATNAWDPLVMHAKKKPFDDPRVRKAIRLACNKDQLIKVCIRGHGQNVVLPLLPNDPVYPSQVKNLPTDIAQAKKLLADAGYANGFETPMYIGVGRPQRERLAEVVADMLKAINVRCKIQRMPIDKFFAEVEGNGEFYTDGFFGDPGADMHIYPMFKTAAAWNGACGHWSNPEVDKLLDEARQTPSVEERKKLYGRLAELINEDGTVMIPWVLNHIVAHRERVQGFRAWPDLRIWLKETWVTG